MALSTETRHRLCAAREAAGCLLHEAALRIGVSAVHLSDIERGLRDAPDGFEARAMMLYRSIVLADPRIDRAINAAMQQAVREFREAMEPSEQRRRQALRDLASDMCERAGRAE